MALRAPLLLVVVAVSHCGLGVVQGLEDGDFGLLLVAAPFVGLTLLAAAGAGSRRSFARSGAVVLSALTVLLAVLLVSAYGLGLFHLPQAVLATVLAALAERRGP